MFWGRFCIVQHLRRCLLSSVSLALQLLLSFARGNRVAESTVLSKLMSSCERAAACQKSSSVCLSMGGVFFFCVALLFVSSMIAFFVSLKVSCLRTARSARGMHLQLRESFDVRSRKITYIELGDFPSLLHARILPCCGGR